MRDKLRKVAGLFVELPPEQHTDEGRAGDPPPSRTVEQLVQEADGPNLDQIQVPTPAPQPAPSAGGGFEAIYQHAGLPAAPFTAEQMLEMLASLPAELPLEVRRQTVKAALAGLGKSIGATPDSIVADASRKLAALTAYSEAIVQETDGYAASAQAEIEALQAQIEAKRRAIEEAGRRREQAITLCQTESDRLDDVLEFFSLDVPPSRHSAPDRDR